MDMYLTIYFTTYIPAICRLNAAKWRDKSPQPDVLTSCAVLVRCKDDLCYNSPLITIIGILLNIA